MRIRIEFERILTRFSRRVPPPEQVSSGTGEQVKRRKVPGNQRAANEFTVREREVGVYILYKQDGNGGWFVEAWMGR